MPHEGSLNMHRATMVEPLKVRFSESVHRSTIPYAQCQMVVQLSDDPCPNHGPVMFSCGGFLFGWNAVQPLPSPMNEAGIRHAPPVSGCLHSCQRVAWWAPSWYCRAATGYWCHQVYLPKILLDIGWTHPHWVSGAICRN